MAFEIENNLVGNPDFLIRTLWENNPEAIQANLAANNLFAYTYSELLQALQYLYDRFGMAGIYAALSIDLRQDRLSAGQSAAIENIMLSIGDSPGVLRGGPFGDPQINPNDFVNDYPSSPATPDNDNGGGGGAHWSTVVTSILGVAGSAFDAFFGNNQQPAAPVQPGTQTPAPAKEANWPLIAGGVLLGIAVLVVIVQLLKKKK